MTWLQLMAVAVGLLALLFFVVFTGYYFRNRRLAMEARRAQTQDGDGPDGVAVHRRDTTGPATGA